MTFGCTGDVQWAESLNSLSTEWFTAAHPEEKKKEVPPVKLTFKLEEACRPRLFCCCCCSKCKILKIFHKILKKNLANLSTVTCALAHCSRVC